MASPDEPDKRSTFREPVGDPERRSASREPGEDPQTRPAPQEHGEDPDATLVLTQEEVERLRGERATRDAQKDDRLIGTLIRDRWKVLEKLGVGSFGTVYKVQDVKGGWIEALKILGVDRMTGTDADEMRARFLREARIMKRLGTESPHIVGLSTYEEDIEAGLIYFLMEFVEGRSLRQVLAEEGPFPVDRTIPLAIQVCEALMTAHEGVEPVIHRDLKLENLMLTEGRSGEEIVKVLDFGIAKIAKRDTDSRLTTVGTLGTPGYAAPEQLRAEPVDGRTDLFSFGVILYALLTGRDPWLGKPAHRSTHRIYELMVATERADVRSMTRWGRSIPQEVVRIVMKLLRREPEQRFQSARELRDALRRLSWGGTEVTTAESSRSDPEPRSQAGVDRQRRGRPSRRAPRAVARDRKRKGRRGRLAAALLVLMVVTTVAWAQPWGRTMDRRALADHVASGAVSRVYLTDGGLEGGLQIVSLEALRELRMPFFVPVSESDIPRTVSELRERGVEVDASWEIRRLTALAVDAQRRNRYYGLDGGDVKNYARRLEELAPGSRDASSLLFKVGERMAWDAEAALKDGAEGRARTLVQGCLELVPDQPRCLRVARSL